MTIQGRTTSPLPSIGFAVYAASGAISWRSVETNRDASIRAFLGDHTDVATAWAHMEAAGYSCSEVVIAPTSLNWPVSPRSVLVNAPAPRDGSLPAAAMIAGELHDDADSAADELMRLRDTDTAGAQMRTYAALVAISGEIEA